MPIDLIAIIIIALILLSINIIHWKNTERNHKEKLAISAKYKDKQVFLCSGNEEIQKNVMQLYGYPINVTILPGMKLLDHRGVQFTIKEVYADDSTPEKPNRKINELSVDSAIVIETAYWDKKGFSEQLKKEKVLAIQIR